MSADPRLARLLEHPAIWRGTSAVRAGAVPTGFAALDARLPGHGWPQSGLVEMLLPCFGAGELYLLLPALAQLTSRPLARWCAWIAPPLEPFAPALAAHGVALSRVLILHTAEPLWACEQALRSGDCDVVLAFVKARVQARALRRLQLATERGRSLGFILRTRHAAATRESSGAALQLKVEPTAGGARVTVLKSRGGVNGALELSFRFATEP
ncbi:MAG TPA: translesion DNA synthesis-associated protein ImuA [Steroidobacteraceae bacterium]|nr:translesion DNA synthesis-associated protein ImuA [Steroidobacteraceae bacterium]